MGQRYWVIGGEYRDCQFDEVVPGTEGAQAAYPYYTQFHGRMHKSSQVEPMCYAALHETSGYRTKYWTMTELYNFAKTDMHAEYMFWVRITNPEPDDSNDYFDALPVIERYPVIN